MKKVVPAEGTTGSNFSIGYTARHEGGTIGFVKVLDITKASFTPDPAATLERLTTAFNYERRLLEKCKGLSRVVTALAEGSVHEPGFHGQIAQYIIFEFADSDLRQSIHFSNDFDLALLLRTLHNVAVGLSQLHSRQIAHQDIKPSNVLMFDDGFSKVGDLGRSSEAGIPAPHDDGDFAGDPTYAPPEYLYNYVPSDWKERRWGCDLYQLGSLVLFMFSGLSSTRMISNYIPQYHRPKQWSGNYRELLDYMHEYFRLMIDDVRAKMPALVEQDLHAAVTQLCNPDPSRRGHPKNHAIGNRFGLERYVSLFNRLALMAEIELRTNIR